MNVGTVIERVGVTPITAGSIPMDHIHGDGIKAVCINAACIKAARIKTARINAARFGIDQNQSDQPALRIQPEKFSTRTDSPLMGRANTREQPLALRVHQD